MTKFETDAQNALDDVIVAIDNYLDDPSQDNRDKTLEKVAAAEKEIQTPDALECLQAVRSAYWRSEHAASASRIRLLIDGPETSPANNQK